MDFHGETVLVTGGSGFIGHHLCRALLDAGAEVVSVSRRPVSALTDLEGDLVDAVRWFEADLGDPDAVDRLVESAEPSVVYHLASHVAGARARELVRPTFLANLASTVHLLDAATRLGCRRFIQVGSLEEPDPGESPAPPSSPYAAAKAAASAYGRMFHRLYGTPVALARLFMVYGPAQGDVRKLVPYSTLELLAGRRPKISSGTRQVDWIHVADVVDGLLHMGLADGIDGQRIDLGTGELHTVGEVVETLCHIVAPALTPEIGAVADRKDEQVRCAQVAESERLIGWRPRFGLEDGLRDTVEWYRTHGS